MRMVVRVSTRLNSPAAECVLGMGCLDVLALGLVVLLLGHVTGMGAMGAMGAALRVRSMGVLVPRYGYFSVS